MKNTAAIFILATCFSCHTSPGVNKVETQKPGIALANAKEYVSAEIDGAVFTSVNAETGLYNPMTRSFTVLGEDNLGVSISLSFPPTLSVSEKCADCSAALFVNKNGQTKSYISANISNLQIKLTAKNGRHVEGAFSFTASKASDDRIAIRKGSFSSEIAGFEP